MSQQTYPVACECGIVHQCPAGYAGSRFACHCGKTVEVPSLSVLKAASGEEVLAPEVEISALMSGNALPFETDCALCCCQTHDSLLLLATCETPAEHQPVGKWVSLVSLLLMPFTGLVVLPVGEQPAGSGNLIQVRLPLRMCQPCASGVSSWDVIRQAMLRTPIYRRLLEKYPGCRIETVKAL